MKKAEVSIVDYGIGNLHSVLKACEVVGMNAKVTHDKTQIEQSDALILPGVGAFGDAMQHLRDLDLIHLIKDYAQSGKPIMGVCLGMQLFMSESEEFGTQKGLGIIEGSCKRFLNKSIHGEKIRVPQINWNTIHPTSGATSFHTSSPLHNIKANEYMYFVHSYYVVPQQNDVTLSLTNYGDTEYCSSIQYKNIFAFQFHPEKSGERGLDIYKNFKEIVTNK